ncbi:MAG TPA: NAD(P)/FAD-dependent oxidoreductase, partial [Flavobacteriales bacterium]|nr:NAD(P)/FAD-dependent oxidoreductase [Flavobacteriales bacterium]
MSRYDAIVIGGGHNGLTTAAYLAKAGKKVVVLEKRDVLGGVAAGEELASGFNTVGLLHDTSEVRKHVIVELGLAKHGLKTSAVLAPVALLSNDGKGIVISADVDETANSIAQYSQKDAEAYVEYKKFMSKISALIKDVFNEHPPDITSFDPKHLWPLARKGVALKRLGEKTMLELLRVTPMCVADYLNEYFVTDFLKAGLACSAVGKSFTGPWSAGTCMNLLMHECLGGGVIDGGPQALISALQKSCEALGVEIKLSAGVEQILFADDSANGVKLEGGDEIHANVVASSATPKTTLLNMIQPNFIQYKLENEVNNIRSRGIMAKLNLGLNKKPAFRYDPSSLVSFARTGHSIDEMEKAFDSVKYGKTSGQPFYDIHVSESGNGFVLSAMIYFAPYNIEGGWTADSKNELQEKVISALECYFENLSGSVEHS